MTFEKNIFHKMKFMDLAVFVKNESTFLEKLNMRNLETYINCE